MGKCINMPSLGFTLILIFGICPLPLDAMLRSAGRLLKTLACEMSGSEMFICSGRSIEDAD
jgi:hypothetical protein